jgi:hypothetical protein
MAKVTYVVNVSYWYFLYLDFSKLVQIQFHKKSTGDFTCTFSVTGKSCQSDGPAKTRLSSNFIVNWPVL